MDLVCEEAAFFCVAAAGIANIPPPRVLPGFRDVMI